MRIDTDPRCRRASSGAAIALRLFVLALTAWIPVAAQSRVEPEILAAAKDAFEQAPTRTQMRCGIAPVRPALNFGLRFQTGYKIEIPLKQFQGTGKRPYSRRTG
jgi:hypothetical protein